MSRPTASLFTGCLWDLKGASIWPSLSATASLGEEGSFLEDIAWALLVGCRLRSVFPSKSNPGWWSWLPLHHLGSMGLTFAPSIPYLCLGQRFRLILLSYIHSNSPALDSLTTCGSSLGMWFQSVCMIIIWCIICSSIELEALSVQGLCWIDFSALCRAKHGTWLMLGTWWFWVNLIVIIGKLITTNYHVLMICLAQC